MKTAEDVLAFWFGGPVHDMEGLMGLLRRYTPALDAAVREQFAQEVDAAIGGAFEAWTETARGTLALIVLLDQLPRHAFRGDKRQYDGDARALSLTLRALEEGFEEQVDFFERVFLLMPLAHAENVEMQRRNVVEADRHAATVPAWAGFFAEIGPSQSRKYCDVIERFGRFPHRNEVLGRASTPEELAFLVDWPARQAPDALRERGLLPAGR